MEGTHTEHSGCLGQGIWSLTPAYLFLLSALRRLTITSAANVQKQLKNENRLRECELEKDQNQEALEQQRQVLEDFESRIGNGLRFFESLINNVPSKSHIVLLDAD